MSRAKCYSCLRHSTIAQWEQGKRTSSMAKPNVTPRCTFTEYRAEEDIFTWASLLWPHSGKAHASPV